ncbi:hypothetical protein CH267_00375 [Rhodococcus sp. 06-621-2]|nr:hypothetical protein CH267_00375 [Rhodococcus sp. 06-621-2]
MKWTYLPHGVWVRTYQTSAATTMRATAGSGMLRTLVAPKSSSCGEIPVTMLLPLVTAKMI